MSAGEAGPRNVGAFVASDIQRWPLRIEGRELKSVSDVLQVIELRTSLEVEAAGPAAQCHSDDDLARIEKALAAIGTNLESGGNEVGADFDFHLAIFESAHNRYFPQRLQFLGHFIVPRLAMHTEKESVRQREGYLHRIQSEYFALFEAIRAARRHLSNALRRDQQSEVNIEKIEGALEKAKSAEMRAPTR